MKFFTLLWIVSSVYTGEVGDYLGLSKNNLWVYNRVAKDSSWGILGDFSSTDTLRDTLKITEEFVYQGNPAYILKKISVKDIPVFEAIDTLWEEGDSLVGPIRPIPGLPLDTTIIGTQYVIPFEIGKSWRALPSDLYLIDVDMDGEKDTVRIIEDSIRVISQEDISVPFGEVESTYKIKRSIKIEGWLSIMGFDFGAEGITIEWYKPYLGRIKDTTYATITVYLAGSAIGGEYIQNYSLLTHTTGIKEKRYTCSSTFFKVEKNPFRNEFSASFYLDRLSNIKLFLYDITGKRVGEIRGSYPAGRNVLRYNLKNLPNGIYFIRLYKNNIEAKKEKVIKIS